MLTGLKRKGRGKCGQPDKSGKGDEHPVGKTCANSLAASNKVMECSTHLQTGESAEVTHAGPSAVMYYLGSRLIYNGFA